MSKNSHRIIVTVISTDRVGIIANVSAVLAQAGANILDISQSVIDEFFVMIMMVDVEHVGVSFGELKASLNAKGEEMGLRIDARHEDVSSSCIASDAASSMSVSRYSPQEIVETIRMVQMENLDIRTITMGISLRDCSHPDLAVAATKTYDKICRLAENLVRAGEEIASEYGIPVINKRISVTPIALVAESSAADSYVLMAEYLDRAAKQVGVNFLGGFSALVQKGMTRGDVALMGRTIVETARLTAAQDGLGCAKLVVFCKAVEDNPFMAGAFHGIGEPECVINVGVSGPGAVLRAIEKEGQTDFGTLAATIKRTAFKITRMGELVGLDMIAIPGDTPAETIAAIIADAAAIGMINRKTTAVRIIPAPGKREGDMVEFGGLLGRAPVMAVHRGESSFGFISRGGRIPAPLQALSN